MAWTGQTEKVEGCQTAIKYRFNDPELLWEALQAAGSPVFAIRGRRLLDGNKRLALLGDTVLKLVLVRDCYVDDQSRGTGAGSPVAGTATHVQFSLDGPSRFLRRLEHESGSRRETQRIGRLRRRQPFATGRRASQHDGRYR